MPNESQAQPTIMKQKPELKLGPFAGGVSVNVWLNTIQTAQGQRQVRSISISPRRYPDPVTGGFKDSYSYRLVDARAILLGLEKAIDYIAAHPLPDEEQEAEQEAPAHGPDIPF